MTWIMLLSKCSTCTYRRREREERESEGYLNYASEHSVREEGGKRERNLPFSNGILASYIK